MIGSLLPFYRESFHPLPGSSSSVADNTYNEESRKRAQALVHSILKHSLTSPSSSWVPIWVPTSTMIYQIDRPCPYFSVRFAESSSQGPRSRMEDETLFVEEKEHFIAAVFDGHGGREVASYVKTHFANKFFSHLSGKVSKTFSDVFNELQTEIEANRDFDKIGTTAVVCYINRKTNHIYTATIGDSEANIYRYVGSKLYSIPLSCLYNWSYGEEAERVANVFQDVSILTEWPRVSDPKLLRYEGLNLSRSLGDKLIKYCKTWKFPVISHEPVVTEHQLLSGDLLVLACDGLKDYVNEDQITSIVCRDGYPKFIAPSLVKQAEDNRTEDNVSVMVFDFIEM